MVKPDSTPMPNMAAAVRCIDGCLLEREHDDDAVDHLRGRHQRNTDEPAVAAIAVEHCADRGTAAQSTAPGTADRAQSHRRIKPEPAERHNEFVHRRVSSFLNGRKAVPSSFKPQLKNSITFRRRPWTHPAINPEPDVDRVADYQNERWQSAIQRPGPRHSTVPDSVLMVPASDAAASPAQKAACS
jgi:hypothetical protein